MLQLRIILFLAVVFVCHSGNVTGGDSVVIELHSGQRIRGHAVARDPDQPDKAVLSVGNDQIQMRRAVSWSRVNRLSAPPAMLIDLQVPAHVKVVNQTNTQLRERNLSLKPDEVATNDAELRGLLRRPPPLPMPDLPSPSPFVEGHVLMTGDCAPCDLLPTRVPCELIPACGWRLPYDPGVVVGVRDQWGFAASDATGLFGPQSVARDLSEPRELMVSVRAFNRNGLADWNSLEVSFQGRTAAGAPCRVRGSLKCSLWVRRVRLVRAYAETYFEEPAELVLLNSWSQFVDDASVDASGVQKVVLALPSRMRDRNQGLSQFGLLAVELDIPGQGRLATTSEPILLRPTDPIRQRSAVDFGAMTLPGQSVSEGGNISGNWPAPLSNARPDSRRFTIQP